MHLGGIIDLPISQSLYMLIPSNYILSSAIHSRVGQEAQAEIIGMPFGDASEPLKFIFLLPGRNEDAIFRQNFLAGGRPSSSKKDAGVGSSGFARSKSDVGVSDRLVGLMERSLSVLLDLVLEQ